MKLSRARELLRRSHLRAENNTFFDNERIDESIKWAGNRFLRQTGLSRTTTSVNTVSGTGTLDVTAASGASSFLPGYLYDKPFISTSGSYQYEQVGVESFDTVRRLLEDSPSGSGVPEVIAWLAPSVAYVYPIPDAIYAVVFPWWQPLTSFEPGTAEEVTLNLPEQYAHDIVMFGARAHFIFGLPGYPEHMKVMEKFEALIEEAKGAGTATGVWLADRDHPTGAYSQPGYI